MRWSEIISEEGKIVQGVNTTADVKPGEIQRQGAKMGFKLDANGLPPVWTGLASSTGAKDTPNKGDPFYGKDGAPPIRKAPVIEGTIPPSAEHKFNTPMIDTPEFKAWFGNSKVVNSDGSPCMCVHATGNDFGGKFDRATQRFGAGGYGFYFTNAKGAARYSDYQMNYQHVSRSPNSIPVFLKMENPLIVRSIEHLRHRLEKNQAFGAMRGYSGNDGPEVLSAIEKMGYDGVITTETLAPKLSKRNGLEHRAPSSDKPKIEYPVFIVFHPEQIKSVMNKGTFNPNSPNISEDDGE